MTTRRRLIWLQPGLPDPANAFASANLPLAAGYTLLGWRGLEGAREWAAEIVDPLTASWAGDAALVEQVTAARPDVLCLTAYGWNVERGIWLAAQVRQRRPETFVLMGGPELAAGSPWTTDRLAGQLDALVTGEGETGLTLALAALAGGAKRPVRVVAPPLADLSDLGDPYSAGLLQPGPDGGCLVESMRGCPWRCHYCHYAKGTARLRRHGPDTLRRFMAWATSRGDVRDVYLIDPTFTAGGGLSGRLDCLAEWNERRLPLHTEARLERVSPSLAARFQRAGFRSIEAGLQSIHPAVCAGVGRRLDLSGFRDGARFLREVGVGLEVGVILGLPGDDLTGFTATLDWLAREGLADEAQVFPLGLLPGTVLRRRALAEGWRFQDRPPYLLLAGGGWGEAELAEGISRAEEILGRTHHPPVPPYVHPPPAGSWRTRVRLDPGDPGTARLWGEQLRELASVCTVDLIWSGREIEWPVIEALGRRMRAECPWGRVRVVVKGPAPLRPSQVMDVWRAFGGGGGYLPRMYHFHADPFRDPTCRVFQWLPASAGLDWLDRLAPGVPVAVEVPRTRSALDRLSAGFNDCGHDGDVFLVGPRPPVPLGVRAIRRHTPVPFLEWQEVELP